MQRQMRVIQSLVILVTICITLLILVGLAQISHLQTNTLLIREQKRSKSATSQITQWVIIPREQMEDVRRELFTRRQRVMQICEIIGLKKSNLDTVLTNVIIDKKHNISWCPIYKAASSTWMNYFAKLGGTLTDATIDLVHRNLVQVNDIVRQTFRHDLDINKTFERIAWTKKFLIVRHPLQRLLSAYRDKLEHMQDREYYYKRFGRHIAHRYRQTGNETKLEPTFEEFLQFIVKEKYFDEHWAPYYQTCKPCIVNYDYILKFETLERDQNFFIQDTNLSKYLYDRNFSRNINPYGRTNEAILGEYIKHIPRSLLHDIYKIYENDYKLFNYSFI